MKKTILTALILISAATSARAQAFSAENLATGAIERRAVEAAIWGMPAVNFERMLQAVIANGGAATAEYRK